MAATVTERVIEQYATIPFVVRTRLSGLTKNLAENVEHGWEDGTVIEDVSFAVVTAPTDGSMISMEWLRSQDSTTNNTVNVRFRCSGSITGAVVDLFCKSRAAGSGGLGL